MATFVFSFVLMGVKKWVARVGVEEMVQQLANLPTFYVEGCEIEELMHLHT